MRHVSTSKVSKNVYRSVRDTGMKRTMTRCTGSSEVHKHSNDSRQFNIRQKRTPVQKQNKIFIHYLLYIILL